jgi:hypothetical protein
MLQVKCLNVKNFYFSVKSVPASFNWPTLQRSITLSGGIKHHNMPEGTQQFGM